MADPKRKSMKRAKEYYDRIGYVADAEYGIPTRCPCGGGIVPEMAQGELADFLPGKRFFTCDVYQADGLHFRQPWVLGVEEEIRKIIGEHGKLMVEVAQLTLRVAELERTSKGKNKDM